MYKSIMVPVDLAHTDITNKAIQLAADLGKHYGATAYLVGVTVSQPSEVAHNPEEYSQKLEQFAATKSSDYGVQFQAKAVTSHDPAIDLDDTLRKVGKELDIDLVIMASHVPGFMDHFFSSRAGYLASHAEISVFVVR